MKRSYVKLSGVKLSGVKLSGVKLSGVKLSGVKLSGVKLSGVEPAGDKPAGDQPGGIQPTDMLSAEIEPSVTSTELLRQAQANNQVAWEQLVGLYSRRMYRWCRRAGLQPADAGNVVQEALQAVARKLGDFRRDRPGDTFRGWLRRITDNKILDHYRQQGRALDTATGGSDGQQQMANFTGENYHEPATWDTTLIAPLSPQTEALQHIVEQVRSQVSERDWKFFWRVVVDGQSAADVGREFGVTANTVRLVKMRLLRRLRGSLGVAGK